MPPPPCPARRARLLPAAVLLLWLGAPAAPAPAELPQLTESEVKAAYVFNFAKYVEWPATAFTGSNAPIVIAVLGSDRITADLRAAVAGKLVNGRPFELRPAAADAVLAGCHIVYLPAGERARAREVAALVRDHPVLTVSDAEAFIQQGGVIGLVKRGENIRLQINLEAANAAGLKVSSKLLALADQVKGRPAKGKD